MKNKDILQAHIGTLDDMGKRFIDAWHRAQAGEVVEETHITFTDLETLLAVLSPKRLALLQYLHRHGPLSVRQLAIGLGRDYKNVHSDVSVLGDAGLLVRDEQGASVPWAELRASLLLEKETA